jgi:DNA-binding transcriptional MerR regulator
MSEAAVTSRYSIHELATLGGLSTRTVRFYISEGLIDRPEGAKRGAWYGERHLQQLLTIRRWTDGGLSLERVRESLLSTKEGGPPSRPVKPGSVEVWSRITLADGLELHVEPGRACLSPEQVRELSKLAMEAMAHLRSA